MTEHGSDPELKPNKLRSVHWLIYGIVAGLIAVGLGGLISLFAFGNSDPTVHVLPIAITGISAVGAGFLAKPVLTWLFTRSQRSATSSLPPEDDENTSSLEFTSLLSALTQLYGRDRTDQHHRKKGKNPRSGSIGHDDTKKAGNRSRQA